MDFISLLTGGSENLYKYLFIGGLGLIILALFYPLDKRYGLACQKDLYNKEICLANLDIDDLKKDVQKLSDNIEVYNHGLDTAKSEKAKKSIKDEANKKFDLILAKRKQLSIKTTEIAYDKDRILTLYSKYPRLYKIRKMFLVGWRFFYCFWIYRMVFANAEKT